MSTRLARSPVPALVVVLGLLCLAPPCLAAGPIKGGRYAGKWSTGGSRNGRRYIAFNVDDHGRAFVSDPRVVFQGSEIAAPCTPASPWDLGGSQRHDVNDAYTTLSDGTPTRIRPNGSFFLSAAVERGGTSASLSFGGRFARSGRLASGSFRVTSSQSGRSCTARGTFTARFTGQRHLAVGSCTPPKTKTLADDGMSRIYKERYVYDPVVRDFDGGYGNGVVIYGCDRATQHRWFLAGDDRPSQGLVDYYSCAEDGGPVALAGAIAGIGLLYGCQAGFGSDIRILDLQTGTLQVDREAAAERFIVPGPDVRPGRVQTVTVAATGSAAWIVCTDRIGGIQLCQVVDEVGYGPSILLDKGDQIDPKSLTLDGSTLSWQNNGETKTATLG